MVNQDFLDALNDCIDRLNQGQSITDCERNYPQHAAELRLRLETRTLVRRIQPNIMEIAQARERARFRLEKHQRQRRRGLVLGRVVGVAFLVMILALGSTEALAQSSLPGDSLYGVKRLTEDIQAAFASDSELAHEQLATRRIAEITRLMALKRSADVDFEGTVQAIGISGWRIAGFTLRVMPDIPREASIQVGDTVTVQAVTTAQGELIARSLTVIHRENPTPTPSPTATDSPTALATVTEAPTLTSSPVALITSTVAPTLTTLPPVSSATRPATSTPLPVRAYTKTPVPVTATPYPVSNGGNQFGGSGSGGSGGNGPGSGGANAGSGGGSSPGSGNSGSGSGSSGSGSGSGNGSGSGSGGRGGSH